MNQKINYEDIVTGKHLDHVSYANKFKFWDKVQKEGKINEYSYMLHDDVTLFAYEILRDDNNQPLKLTTYQDAIVSCRHDNSPEGPNRYMIFKAANQIGKSLLLDVMAIHNWFYGRNVNIIMISRSLKQSQFLLASIRHLLNNSVMGETWRESLGETANTTILTLQKENGKVLNRIICAPVGEGTLGYPAHYMYLDEIDFYEDAKTFFYKVAKPRTNKTKGQIICFSNPNPDIARSSSILWDLWNGDLCQRKFSFRFLDAPWNTLAEYERDKRNTPSHIFASTHDGEFSEEGGAFFKHKEIQDMLQHDWINTLPPTDKNVFIALDIGKMLDQTILMVGKVRKSLNHIDKYDDLDIRYIHKFPLRTDYDVIVNKLIKIRRNRTENVR